MKTFIVNVSLSVLYDDAMTVEKITADIRHAISSGLLNDSCCTDYDAIFNSDIEITEENG